MATKKRATKKRATKKRATKKRATKKRATKKRATKKRATKKRATKRNPVAAATKARPVTRQTKFAQRKRDTDHVIVSVLKSDAAEYAKKRGIDLPEKVYFDGFEWTLDIKKAARYHDMAQAKKVAIAVSNSRIHDGPTSKSRSVAVEADTAPPKM